MNPTVYITVSDSGVSIAVSNPTVTIAVSQNLSGVGLPSGGAAGMHLAKLSSTNYDVGWVFAPAGPNEGAGPVDLGVWRDARTLPSVGLTLPGDAAQEWAYLYLKLRTVDDGVEDLKASVAPGGTVIGAGQIGFYYRALWWRIA